MTACFLSRLLMLVSPPPQAQCFTALLTLPWVTPLFLPALSAHPLSVSPSQASWQGIQMMTQYTACLHRTAWSQSIFNLICSLSPYLLLSTPSLAPDTFYTLIRITKRLEKWSGNQHFWNVLSQQSWPALLLTCLRCSPLSLSVPSLRFSFQINLFCTAWQYVWQHSHLGLTHSRLKMSH